MDQSTILDALQRALSQGSGSLDDLDALMDRVKGDIAKAKQEEAAAAKKKAEEEAARKAAEEKAKLAQGQRIAELATRLLAGEPTSEDVAFMFQTYLRHSGIEDAEVTAEGIEEGLKASHELNSALNELAESFADLFGGFVDKNKNVNQPKPRENRKETADDVIARFLKSHGL